MNNKGGANVKAGYIFVYVYKDDQWKITHHHSSVLPKCIAVITQPMTKSEVKNIYHPWNKALVALESNAIAKCYAKNGVLLPTLSDVAKTHYPLTKDYFDNFMKP